jgi:hypothetical protein
VPLVDPIERRPRALVERALQTIDDALHPVEPSLDSVPARSDQVDQKGQIFDSGAPLGVQVALKSLEAPDRLAREPAYLGDVATDGEHLGTEALLNGFAHAVRYGRLELGRAGCKVVERFARSCERGLESGRLGTARGRFREAIPGAFERLPIHVGDCSVGVGLNDDRASSLIDNYFTLGWLPQKRRQAAPSLLSRLLTLPADDGTPRLGLTRPRGRAKYQPAS